MGQLYCRTRSLRPDGRALLDVVGRPHIIRLGILDTLRPIRVGRRGDPLRELAVPFAMPLIVPHLPPVASIYPRRLSNGPGPGYNAKSAVHTGSVWRFNSGYP